MPEDIVTLFKELRVAAQSKNFASISTKLERLLKLAKMAEPPLLEFVSKRDEATACAFWGELLKPSAQADRDTVVRSAHCVLSMMRDARTSYLLSTKQFAKEYCVAIVSACAKFTGEKLLALAAPAKPDEGNVINFNMYRAAKR